MNKTVKLAVAGALLSLSAVAGAATVTQQSAVIVDITHLSGSTNLGFTAFDTSLGTLTGAQVTFYSTISGTVRVENLAATPEITTVGSGAALSLTLGSLPAFSINTVYSQDVSLGAYDGNPNYNGTSGTIKTFSGQSVVTSSGLITGSQLSAFTSGGAVASSVSGIFSGAGTGNVRFSGNSTVNTYAVLTYTYTPPVPEPETYGMMLAGLGLVGAIARRKAKKAA